MITRLCCKVEFCMITKWIPSVSLWSPTPLKTQYPPTPSITWSGVQKGSIETTANYSVANFIESDHDSAASHHDKPLHKEISESKALVPIPNPKSDALAVVPLRKSKRSESAQRRIRRPFAVAEVGALVQAVEKLGTGRISGKHWSTQQEYLPNKDGANLFPRSFWTRSWLPTLTGHNSKLSNSSIPAFSLNERL